MNIICLPLGDCRAEQILFQNRKYRFKISKLDSTQRKKIYIN